MNEIHVGTGASGWNLGVGNFVVARKTGLGERKYFVIERSSLRNFEDVGEAYFVGGWILGSSKSVRFLLLPARRII